MSQPIDLSTTHRPRILLVEDDMDAAALITEALDDHFGPGCVAHRRTVAQAISVDTTEFDIVLSDLNLTDGTGMEVLEKLLKRRADLPIVIVTGEGSMEAAMQAIRVGAYDYVVKVGEYLFTIPLVVEKNLAIWRTKQENADLHERLSRTLAEVRLKNEQLQEMVERLEAMATTDPLTGLANRRAFVQGLQRCFAEAGRYGHDLACVMIDLDNFKLFNDTLGHQAGDELLRRVGQLMRANCRRSDIAARFGGDEFVLLLPQTDRQTARQVALRIARDYESIVQRVIGEREMPHATGMSAGLACLRLGRPVSGDQLVAQADQALYRAKDAGKTRLAVYDGGGETKMETVGALAG